MDLPLRGEDAEPDFGDLAVEECVCLEDLLPDELFAAALVVVLTLVEAAAESCVAANPAEAPAQISASAQPAPSHPRSFAPRVRFFSNVKPQKAAAPTVSQNF
jgi:hypothetical protein